MAFWVQPYKALDAKNYGGVDQALSQHRQLLEVSGFPCKVLFKKMSGNEVGNEVTPILISIWDTTSPIPKKTIWTFGNDEDAFPDVRSVRVWVDGVELSKTYDSTTIQTNNEFYVVSQVNVVGINDNIAIYFNSGFVVSGKTVTFLYTTIAKNINVLGTLQPSEYPNTFRTEFVNGFTQYVNPSSKFRGKSYPNTILISFPPTPFDTIYVGQGKYQQQVNPSWTMGDKIGYPMLHEFDILYRIDEGNWYEIVNYNPNPIYYKGEAIIATQQFETRLLAPTDDIKNFKLL